MRTLLYTTAATLTLAGAAFAQSSDQLRQSVEQALDESNLNVDVQMLSDEQVAEIYAISQQDGGMGERGQIMAVFEGAGYQSMELGEEMIFVPAIDGANVDLGANSLRDEVGLKLEEHGFDNVATDDLTDDEVAKLYTIVQNSDTEAARARIDAILN